jgi:hypothetical protein
MLGAKITVLNQTLTIEKLFNLFAPKIQLIIFNYKLNNNKLSRVSLIKDIGIHFDSDLSFMSHHKIILNKS